MTEPRLERVTLVLCSLCLDGVGGECHVPGCALWMSAAPDVPIRDMAESCHVLTEPEPVIEPDRFRLIPTRGRGHSWHVYGAEEARADAERYVSENEIGVLVCAAPEKGIVRELYTVKAPEKPRAKKRSAA